ncbi:hypothetical protein, variant [Sphaeroforma arctica JP610]|uniref:Uncharacterized protein n=1 Tax=Sphaeroforma arctica JP610 TaxID=667725 RepID=A0A0L0FM30_9EUKA|nr:hypothetical protein, variant [Sphaeroforma arctica JP610]KNC77837.1 hypothetical protein, variant [Sphaeroforma arctica JP610]|eukprot:XP_014151739.1 hypothetical protein, variant [Sphaeroforma arctica JP610]
MNLLLQPPNVASENQRSEDEVEHDINSQYTSHDDGAEREYKSPVGMEEYIALQEEFTLLSEAQNDLQQDFELLNESQSTLVAEHDELQKYATQLETELDEFKEQNAEVGKRWAAYEAKHTAVKAELAAAQKQVETYLKSTTEMREKLATAEAQEQTKTSQVQALQIELKSLNDELTTLDEEKGRLLAQAANMSGENSSVKEAMKAEVASMKLALEAEEKKAVEARNEVVMLQLKLESEAQEATTEMGSLHYQIENLQVSIKDADRVNRTIQREREEIQKQFEEYKKRAGKILQEKDVLIGQMKFGGAGGDLSSSGTGSTVDAQRDMEALRSELLQSQIQIKELRFELKNVEEQHERDMEVQADTADELESELSAMRTQMHQLESRHLNTIEEYKSSLAEANAAKSTLAQQLQTQQSETAQMQASFTAAEPRTEALVELEARMNNLTDQLINQQQVVESLTTANATLSLQLESEKNKYTRDVTRRQEEDEANSRKISKDLELGGSTVPRPVYHDQPRVVRGFRSQNVRSATGAIDAFSYSTVFERIGSSIALPTIRLNSVN